MPLPSRSTSAGLPVVLDTVLLPCSPLPLGAKEQNPIVFALMVALPVVMFQILLQRSPQRRFSKQDQPRQTFVFDRLHPAFCVRVQIRASCWQSKRIHTSRLDQVSKGWAELRISVVQQIAAAPQACQCERIKSFQETVCFRFGAGEMPCRRRTLPTV